MLADVVTQLEKEGKARKLKRAGVDFENKNKKVLTFLLAHICFDVSLSFLRLSWSCSHSHSHTPSCSHLRNSHSQLHLLPPHTHSHLVLTLCCAQHIQEVLLALISLNNFNIARHNPRALVTKVLAQHPHVWSRSTQTTCMHELFLIAAVYFVQLQKQMNVTSFYDMSGRETERRERESKWYVSFLFSLSLVSQRRAELSVYATFTSLRLHVA